MTPHSDVVGHRLFVGTCCLHLHPADGGSMFLRNGGLLPHGVTDHETAIERSSLHRRENLKS